MTDHWHAIFLPILAEMYLRLREIAADRGETVEVVIRELLAKQLDEMEKEE